MVSSFVFRALVAVAALAMDTSAQNGFLCPVPVIPANLGPSNACCTKLVELPLSKMLNPVDGAVYWGVKCTVAEVQEEVGSDGNQAITSPCATGLSNACCDPTFRKLAGSGPCTLPISN